MKLLAELQKQVAGMDELRIAWFTSFNADIEFVEKFVLPTTIGAERPRSRLEYEQIQQELTTRNIDFRIFCDPRFLDASQVKQTCIPVHGVRPVRENGRFSDASLFHPKVIYLEDVCGKRVIGAGSANLTLSGWGLNVEAFQFFEIKSSQNYSEIRKFFNKLCDAVEIERILGVRRKFAARKEGWQFVHSYQERTFTDQLLDGAQNTDLVVWSPYLPRDLAGFIGRFETAGHADGLRLHLVPDRIDGKHLRTEWNDAFSELKSIGRLRFYERPDRHKSDEGMFHAKLWKLPGKFAVGSWNFTGPGSNSLQNGDGAWSKDNNVEAGFIINDRHDWTAMHGRLLDLGPSDFADPQQLKEESLDVDLLPPFDIHVSFDWKSRSYSVDGQWLGGTSRDGYSLQLPGVTGVVSLAWHKDCPRIDPENPEVDDQTVLVDRVFKVFRGGREVQLGLIRELNVTSRRSQTFHTLQDLLEAFVHNDEPPSMPDLPFRGQLETDGLDGDDRPVSEEKHAADSGEISYFRLFCSMQHYRDTLADLGDLKSLDQRAFIWPGCLLELVSKVREQIKQPGNDVFNCFLANEVNSLCEFARSRRRSLRRGKKQHNSGYDPIPWPRWRKELTFDVPDWPHSVSSKYSALVMEDCDYG